MGNTLRELQKKYARQSKNKKAWGWFQNNNSGNSIIGNKFFNMAMGSGGCAQAAPDGGIGAEGNISGSMGEDFQYDDSTCFKDKSKVNPIGGSDMEDQEVVFYYSPELKDDDDIFEVDEVKLVVSKDDIIRALCQLLRDDSNFVYMDNEEFDDVINEHWESIKDDYYEELHEYFSHNVADSSTSRLTEDFDYDDDVEDCECESDEEGDPYLTSTMFENIDSEDPEVKVTEYDKLSSAFLDSDLEEAGQYELIARKTIRDADGFTTDYSWYRDTRSDEDRYVMVFGDSDIYQPEDGEFDVEFDNYEVAEEWFNNYNGFEDEDIDECFHKEINYLESNCIKKPVSPYDEYDPDLLKETISRDLITLRQMSDYEDFDVDVHSDNSVEITYYDAKGNAFTRKYSDATEALEDLYDRGYFDQEDSYSEEEDFEYDDSPLDEAMVKEIDIDLRDPRYIDKLKDSIQALRREIHFLKYQAPREVRKGGAFDSQEEIDEAISTTERELRREEAKLAIILRRVEQ